jgi:Mg2+/Co2+ transporter CorC
LLSYQELETEERPLSDFLRAVSYVPTDKSIALVLEEIVSRKDMPQFALVIDDYGGVAGLLTMKDIIQRLFASKARSGER